MTLKARGFICSNVMFKNGERIMTVYGYARVSTDGQTLAAQDGQLHAAGCAKVFSEKVSGAKTDRAALGKLLKRLEPGDVLVVTRLDRLARSTRDLLNILDTIAKAGAGAARTSGGCHPPVGKPREG